MASVKAPEPGVTVEQTVRTRTIPRGEEEQPDKRDFWEFTAALTLEQWNNYVVYVYRRNPGSDELGPFIGKYANRVTEDFLAEKHGGGKYRLFLKTAAGELKKRADLEIEGPPIIATAPPAAAPAASTTGDGTVKELCDLLRQILQQNAVNSGQPLVNDAMKNALSLQSDGFRAVVNNVRDVLQPAASTPTPNPMDDLMRQFMAAAIAKMMNPASPIEEFSKMITAVKTLGLDGGGSHSSIGVELVRTAAQALPQIVEGVKAYTGAVKAQADVQMLAMQRGVQPGAPAAPAPVAAPPPANVVEMPPPATPAPDAATPQKAQEVSVVVTIDDIERHIAMLIVRESLPVRDAADSCLDYIETVSPQQLYPYVCSLDEANLTAFIKSRPILSQVVGHVRFNDFVKAIVELTRPAASDSASTPPQSPA